MAELKPCKHCGSEKIIIKVHFTGTSHITYDLNGEKMEDEDLSNARLEEDLVCNYSKYYYCFKCGKRGEKIEIY